MSPRIGYTSAMNKITDSPTMKITFQRPLRLLRNTTTVNAAAKLQTQGFQPLILNGGIAAWQNANLPLVKEKS